MPTPRAVTERLLKIRQQARESGAGNFSISSPSSKNNTSPSTPRRPRASNGSTLTPGSSGGSKRKRTTTKANEEVQEVEETDLDIDPVNTPSKVKSSGFVVAGSSLGIGSSLAGVGTETGIGGDGMFETPSKRARIATALPPDMVSEYYDEEEEEEEKVVDGGDGEDSAGDYVYESDDA